MGIQVLIFLKGDPRPVPGRMDGEGEVRTSEDLYGLKPTPTWNMIDRVEDLNGNRITNWR